MNGVTLVELMIIIAVVALVGTAFLVMGGGGLFESEAEIRNAAVNALDTQGFSDVKIRNFHRFGATWYGCGSDDAIAVEVTALNPRNRRVDLVACMGWPFKGVTIRSQ